MRKSVLATTVAVLSLVLAGVALAAFTQHSNITFTATKAGQSTGIKADVFSTVGPGEPTSAYKPAKQLVVTFPAGTKFNLGQIKPCTVSDRSLASGASCPASSQIGTGSAEVVAPPLPQKFSAGVKAYASGRSSMVILATATKPVKTTVVIHETIKGNKLIIPVPTSKVAGFNVVLVKLSLNVPARGSGKAAMIRAGKCTAGQFVIKTHAVYKDGSTADVVSTSACS